MKKILGAMVLASGVGMSGCASIVSDSSYPVTLTTTPSGVSYTITNTKKGYDMMSGETPATVTLPASNGFFSKAHYAVTFEKTGYDPVSVPLRAGMDGWYVGNILFGGLLGILIIDPATGSMWKLDESVRVALKQQPKEDIAEPVAEEVEGEESQEQVEKTENLADQLTLLTIDQIPAHYRHNLVQIH
ncbi:MAG: hypothetical protein ACFE0K_16140 [Alcanivorax sp.]|uniref:hypothetical protein n=1 Tax=Alcanivorax sp. TaxID=1872427 RepID=UPI003DA75731